jgi:hypothetical protein
MYTYDEAERPGGHYRTPAADNRLGSIIFISVLLGVVLVALLSIIQKRMQYGGKMAGTLNNGRQIYLGMRNYALDSLRQGRFPEYLDDDKTREPFKDSNAALSALLPRYIDDKEVFFNRRSMWCTPREDKPPLENTILPGENDWVYVRGLKDSSNGRWPLLANAFAPGTLTYVSDPDKPGGVWKGANAVVIWAGGSAEIVDTKQLGDAFYVKRPDKPAANAFAKDTDWLNEPEIEVLLPLLPP